MQLRRRLAPPRRHWAKLSFDLDIRAWDMCNPARRARRLRSTESCRIFPLIIILNQKQRCRSKLDHKYPLRRRKTSQRSATIATYAQRLARPSSKRGITSVLTASSPAFRSVADLGVKSARSGRRIDKVSFRPKLVKCRVAIDYHLRVPLITTLCRRLPP